MVYLGAILEKQLHLWIIFYYMQRVVAQLDLSTCNLFEIGQITQMLNKIWFRSLT